MSKLFLYVLIAIYGLFSIANGIYEIIVYRNNSSPHLIILMQNMLKMATSSILSTQKKPLDMNISVVALFFFISSICFTDAVKYLNLFVISTCMQTKLIFIFILSNIFIEKSCKASQITGVVLIIVTNIISNYKLYSTEKSFSPYVLVVIFGNFLSASAYIVFERRIKKMISSYWNYIFTFTFNSIVFNLISMLFNKDDKSIRLFDLIFVVTSTVNAVCLTKLSLHTKPMQYILFSIMINISITFLYQSIFEKKINLCQFVCCLLTYFGVFIHEWHRIVR